MCANCKPVGLKIDGEKLITVYSPANAAFGFEHVPLDQKFIGRGPDSFEDWWSDMDYTRTKLDQ